MKPKLLHNQAMAHSFEAKQALERGDFKTAHGQYKLAARLESQVAEFYFDRPELEPTRGIMIRSAAFLNLKAGLVEEAKKFIYFGLLHIGDAQVSAELNGALELAISTENK